jgi:hypothetical protein
MRYKVGQFVIINGVPCQLVGSMLHENIGPLYLVRHKDCLTLKNPFSVRRSIPGACMSDYLLKLCKNATDVRIDPSLKISHVVCWVREITITGFVPDVKSEEQKIKEEIGL